MTCGPEGCREPGDARPPLPRDEAARKQRPYDTGPPGMCAATWTTTTVPGAIAVLQLVGDIEPVMQQVADKVPAPGEIARVSFMGLDTGVIARVHPRFALLMPHGGLRIRERLQDALIAQQVMYAEPSFGAVSLSAIDFFPEADDDEEADILEAMARSASPMALLPLVRAAARVNTRPPGTSRPVPTAEDVARGVRLWRLIEPARVAVIGRPNAGKSTLLNRLGGDALALVGPEPGLTRDAVAARIDLEGLVVDWFDMPGARADAEPIEAEAIGISETLLRSAEMVIELAEPGGGWPASPKSLAPGVHRLRVLNKCDLPNAESSPEWAASNLRISAANGDGIPELVRTIRETLVPKADLDHPGPWVLPRNTAYRPTIE